MKLSQAQECVLEYIHVCAGDTFPPPKRIEVLLGQRKDTIRSIRAMERKGALKIVAQGKHVSGPFVRVELQDPYRQRSRHNFIDKTYTVVYDADEFQQLQLALRRTSKYMKFAAGRTISRETKAILLEGADQAEYLLSIMKDHKE